MKALYPPRPPIDGPAYNHAEHTAAERHYGFDYATGRSASGTRTVSIRKRAGSRRTKRKGLKLTEDQFESLAHRVAVTHFSDRGFSSPIRESLGVTFP